MDHILESIFVNIPFGMLVETYLEFCIAKRINPEIGLDAPSLDSYPRAAFVHVAGKLHDHGLKLTFHAPFMDLAPGSTDAAIRAVTRSRFEQVLRLLPVFRPVSVVCHAGYEPRRHLPGRASWLEKTIEMWTWMGKHVAAEGSYLMLENVYEDGPQDIEELFKNLDPSTVKFCLDTGHQHAFSRSGLAEWVGVLGCYLGQLHLHDNDGTRDDHHALGAGTVDFALLFQKLNALRTSPPVVTLEPHREEDLWPALAALKTLWPWPQTAVQGRR